MAKIPEENAPTAWHRYFGIECNNLGWELALAEGILAHAAKLCGREQLHKDMYTQAISTLGKIESQEDRETVEATFAHVPVP
jgi:hypothetical protein